MNIINFEKNPILFVDTPPEHEAPKPMDDGYYWIRIKNGDEEITTVGHFENGLWYLVGCENPETYQHFVSEIISSRLIDTSKPMREFFEETWVSSGEDSDKLSKDEFGCYDYDEAFVAYNWFKIGIGSLSD